MEDVTTSSDKAHLPRAAQAPRVQGAEEPGACLTLPLGNLPIFREQLDARLPPARHIRGVARRVYAAVHDSDAVAVVAAGPIEAIEQPEVAAAPIGSLLLTDEAGDRGRLVAERELHGWVLVLGDGGRRA